MRISEIATTKQDEVENNFGSIRIQIRSNLGGDTYLSASSLAEALTLAKQHRTPDNHMVCIENDCVRIQRWDRDRVKNSNRWRRVDLDEMEVLGQIREIIDVCDITINK